MKAVLHLKNGLHLEGTYYGPKQVTSGEVVFNTGMTGYPETMTDPSYAGQILVFTYPMMGNYGVARKLINGESPFESMNIHLRAIVVQELVDDTSCPHAECTLKEWCEEHGVPIIADIDTRNLTKTLRTTGAILGQVVPEGQLPLRKIEDPNELNLVGEVTTGTVEYIKGERKKPTVLVVDCGAKMNILRELTRRGSGVIRVPYDYDFLNDDLKFDGILLSNGPGDPKQCTSLIGHVTEVMKRDIPIFGICLGCQIMALAAGADTYKLSFGHRGQNQPAYDTRSKKAIITSQNHGFAVDEKTLPKGFHVWFKNLNDDSVEGIYHESKPFSAVQFHPEACPGPTDSEYLFDQFLSAL